MPPNSCPYLKIRLNLDANLLLLGYFALRDFVLGGSSLRSRFDHSKATPTFQHNEPL